MFVALCSTLKQDGAVTFTVRAHAGASCTRAKQVLADGTIKIDVAAVPEDGKANAELIRFLAEEFAVPKSHVRILRGQTSKAKTVQIRS